MIFNVICTSKLLIKKGELQKEEACDCMVCTGKWSYLLRGKKKSGGINEKAADR